MANASRTQSAPRKPLPIIINFIHRTVSLRRAFVLYGRGNAMLVENLANWRAAAELLFKERGIIEITTAGNKLFFGDTLIAGDSPFAGELVETLRRLIIRRLSLSPGIGDEEIYRLMEMLSMESRALLILGGPVAWLAKHGAGNVSTVENVYLKRIGQTGEVVLDEGKLTVEDLHFIRQQLKNMIALTQEGFELRGEEWALIAEVTEHPTFLGELLKEMTDDGAGVAPPEARAQGKRISGILEALVLELRKGGRLEEQSLAAAISSTLAGLDEPTRLELLEDQFAGAGQLPPLLADEVFDCSPEAVSAFIAGVLSRGPREAWRAASLIRKLIRGAGKRDEIISRIRNACTARGPSAAEAEKTLCGILDSPPPPDAASRRTAEPHDEERAHLRKLGMIPVDRAALGARCRRADDDGEEAMILAGLMGSAPSAGLISRAAARVMEAVSKGRPDTASPVLGKLLSMLSSEEKAISRAAEAEVRRLCAGGAVRSLLLASPSAEDRAAFLSSLLSALPPGDAAMVWDGLAGDGDRRMRDILVEAGRRDARAAAEMIQRQILEGKTDLLSRSVEVLHALPAEISAPLLMDLCRHPEPAVRLKAASLLGKAGLARAVPLLLVLAGDGNREVRRTALPILGHFGGAEAAGKLMEIAADREGVWEVEDRILACRALAKCGGERAVPVLAEIVRESRGQKRGRDLHLLHASARFALESIGGPAARTALAESPAREGSFLRKLFGGR